MNLSATPYQQAKSALSAAMIRKDKRAAKAKELWGDKKRVKKPKAKTLSKLRAELWEELSEYVKARDRKRWGNECPTCPTRPGRPIDTACHIVPKSESAWTYYDPDNVYGGCHVCNNNERWNRATWASVVFPARFQASFVEELYRRAHPKGPDGRPLVKDWSRDEVLNLIEKYRGLNGC